MNVRIIGAFVLIGVATVASAATQPKCDETQSLLACFQDLSKSVEAVKEHAKENVKAVTKEALDETKTGADTSGSATASTLTDLAPFFDALGLLSSDESTGNQLAFNLNFLLPVQNVESHNTQLQLLVNTQPEPLDQLVQAFAEAVRESRKAALQKDIPMFGDAELKLNWSLINTRFGRDFRAVRHLLTPIFDAAGAAARVGVSDAEFRGDELKYLNVIGSELDGNFAVAQGTPIKEIAEPLRSQLVAATIRAAVERGVMTKRFDAQIAHANLDRLADLVAQQPQLLFNVLYKSRDVIVGPDEASAGLTWEFNSQNLGNFLSGEGVACKDNDVRLGTAVYSKCVTALSNYLAQDFKQQWRFKLQAAYKRVGAVSYSYPQYQVGLALPKTKRVEVAIGAGREFSGKPDLGRLDFELSYDSNVDNDTANKDRLKAAVTVTKRIGDLDVPFSIVYANKNEFLGEVDHQISMHVGIKFRQPGQK